jgi:hypothetical protein
VPRSGTLKRSTTGQLSPKEALDIHVFNGIEIPDCLPLNKDRGDIKMVLITKSGDVSSAELEVPSLVLDN